MSAVDYDTPTDDLLAAAKVLEPAESYGFTGALTNTRSKSCTRYSPWWSICATTLPANSYSRNTARRPHASDTWLLRWDPKDVGGR